MSNIFTTGDSKTKLVQVEINDAPFIIDPSSTVQAQIVDKTKLKVLSAAPVACTSTQVGAAWATSLVAVKFPKSATVGIKMDKAEVDAFLELQITLGADDLAEDYTKYIPIILQKGNIV